MTFREQIYEKFKTNIAQYTITKVNNNEFTRFFPLSNSCEELTNEEVKIKKGRPRTIEPEVEEPVVKFKRGPKSRDKPED